MARAIFTTPGIVLARGGVGESSLLLSLLTREYGRIEARAQGARNAGSKLRFGLEPLHTGLFSLVKGVAGWKIVGVERAESLISSPAGVKTLGNITALLSRLAPPHEAVPALFDLVRKDLFFLGATSDGDVLRNGECITVLHILSHLGYVPTTEGFAPFIEQESLTESLIETMKPLRKEAVILINTSLAATGL